MESDRIVYIRNMYLFLLFVVGFQRASSEFASNLGVFSVTFEIILTDQIDDGTTLSPSTGVTKGSTPMTSPSIHLVSEINVTSYSSIEPQHTTSSLLSTTTSSGQPQNVTDAISLELYGMLHESFSSTTAYMSISQPHVTRNTDSRLTYEYYATYNKTFLNDLTLLSWNSSFIDELRNVTEDVVNISNSFQKTFWVHKQDTREAMDNAIDALNAMFSDVTWLCKGADCAASGATCRQNSTTDEVVCVSKCEAFEAGNTCTEDPSVYGVYVRGTCHLDAHGNPYCDCGMSPGDVMRNFFDGQQCVSVTFIVAMAASAGGFFFILWLLTLGVSCAKSRSRPKSASRKSSTAEYSANYNGYSEGYTTVELGQRSHNKNHSPHEHQAPAHNENIYDNNTHREEADDVSNSVRL